MSLQKEGLFTSPTNTIVTKSFNRSIPNTTPLDHCRHLRYLQPQHQHLHGHGDSHIRICGSISPPIIASRENRRFPLTVLLVQNLGHYNHAILGLLIPVLLKLKIGSFPNSDSKSKSINRGP
jgi:hypothetical protein